MESAKNVQRAKSKVIVDQPSLTLMGGCPRSQIIPIAFRLGYSILRLWLEGAAINCIYCSLGIAQFNHEAFLEYPSISLCC